MRTQLTTLRRSISVLGHPMARRPQFLGLNFRSHLARGPRTSQIRAWGRFSNALVRGSIVQITTKIAPMLATRTPLSTLRKRMGSSQWRRAWRSKQAWRIYSTPTSALLSQVHIITPKYRFIMPTRILDVKICFKCKTIEWPSTNFSSPKFYRKAPLKTPQRFWAARTEILKWWIKGLSKVITMLWTRNRSRWWRCKSMTSQRQTTRHWATSRRGRSIWNLWWRLMIRPTRSWFFVQNLRVATFHPEC